jgi:hypothetical protein
LVRDHEHEAWTRSTDIRQRPAALTCRTEMNDEQKRGQASKTCSMDMQ